MRDFTLRLDVGDSPLPQSIFCDAWLIDGQRFSEDEGLGVNIVGRWPGKLETEAVLQLARAVGKHVTWDACAVTPPVAQKLSERAQRQPLDTEIRRYLQNLQHICYKPRLHLRVKEERLAVSRARRISVRAVADLVSHPGDWEHRTLRSIQPSKILARQVEDDWNLYENRVVVRLIDHLLVYLARRLEELRKIKEAFDNNRDYSTQMDSSSFQRARRIAELWSNTLDSKTEEVLDHTMKYLDFAQRDLQALLGSPLYQEISSRQSVALSLKPTNILVNDLNYRKVARLWRLWVKFGHKRQETQQQRVERRQREAIAWDCFILHLVIRSFKSLGWAVFGGGGVWELKKQGWSPVRVKVGDSGIVQISSNQVLQLLPLCANLAGFKSEEILKQIEILDTEEGEIVIAHAGASAVLSDVDRSLGWSIGGRAVLFACSPWDIDSEERMTRVLHGWLSRAAIPDYPAAIMVKGLPKWDQKSWLKYDGDHLVAFRVPSKQELLEAQNWAKKRAKNLDERAQRARAAKQAFNVAPREAITVFQDFIKKISEQLEGLDFCPVCGGKGCVNPRPGKHSNGSDATWWATCQSCKSEWGTRPCTECGCRYRALLPKVGLDWEVVSSRTAMADWPDRVLGRDVWAQPCALRPEEHFRCSDCGQCSSSSCTRCGSGIDPGHGIGRKKCSAKAYFGY